MGLDISLIQILPKPENKTCWLLCEDSPELSPKYSDRQRNLEDEDGEMHKVYWYKEIAHQRKGVSKSFYKNYADEEFLFTKSELLILSGYIHHDYKESFQKTFITHFKEGEHLILLSH